MTDHKSVDLSGEFNGLSVSEAAKAYKEMADNVLATMYSLVADELLIRTKERLARGEIATLLDLGTGMGNLAAELSKRFVGRRVIALDLSPDVLGEAVKLGGLPRGVRPVAGDGTRLPLADGSVDVAASYGMVHHVSDKRGLFAEVQRILAPGGIALVLDLTARAPQPVVDAITAVLSPAAAHAFKESISESVSPDEAEMILKDAGVADFTVTTSPISRRAVAMNAWALRAAPMRVRPTDIIWGAYIRKQG